MLSSKQLLNLKKNSFKCGHKIWVGKHHSEKTKDKLRNIILERKKKFGYINSLETRKKISKTLKGDSNPSKRIEVRRKIKNANIGKKLSKEHKEKIGETISKIQFGINNPNWKGGITSENEKNRKNNSFKGWREAVFARDNYTCQKTKIKGVKLHPHHIQNFAEYPELRYEVSNGITLSEKEHRKFHRIYGWTKNTREQLEKFLSN